MKIHFISNLIWWFLFLSAPIIPQEEWKKVLKVRDKETRLQEILEKLKDETFDSENFRQKFFKQNSNWIIKNFKLIFSPTTTHKFFFFFIKPEYFF